MTQALLVARGRVDLHRRLGWAGPMIAVLLVLFGYYTITEGAFRATDLSGDIYRILMEPGSPFPLTDAENIAGFLGSLGELITFSLLVAAGILFKHRAELHNRLMVFALMPVPEALLHLSGTLVGRVPLSRGVLFIGMLVIDIAVTFIPAVHDKLTRGRIHPASLWIPLLIIAWYVVLNAVVAPSAIGLKVGSWLLK